MFTCNANRDWGKPLGKRPHVRPRRGWENNIGMDFKEYWRWVELPQGHVQWWVLVLAVLNF
jgi:hypothetical protein